MLRPVNVLPVSVTAAPPLVLDTVNVVAVGAETTKYTVSGIKPQDAGSEKSTESAAIILCVVSQVIVLGTLHVITLQ